MGLHVYNIEPSKQSYNFYAYMLSSLYANKLDSPTPLVLILSPNNPGISLTWLLDRTNLYSKTTTLLMVFFKNTFSFLSILNLSHLPNFLLSLNFITEMLTRQTEFTLFKSFLQGMFHFLTLNYHLMCAFAYICIYARDRCKNGLNFL